MTLAPSLHTFDNSMGQGSATFCDFGNMECYAYPTGMLLTPPGNGWTVNGTPHSLTGDIITICHNDMLHFVVIPATSDHAVRWFVDNVEQTETSLNFNFRFPSIVGIHTVMAVMHGDCSPNWCDTMLLVVQVNASSSTDVHAVCESYTWIDGNTYTSSNTTATHTLTNAIGCDSVVTLNLTVNNNDSNLVLWEFPENFPVTVNGISYTIPGRYQQHLTNVAGCDSTLNIQVIQYPDNVDSVICTVGVIENPWDAQVLGSVANVHNYYTPLVGDIDGDGVVEIVAGIYPGSNTEPISQIGIFRGTDLTRIGTINVSQKITCDKIGPMAIVRYPNGSGGLQGAVILHCNDSKLRSYDIHGNLLHTSNNNTPCKGAVSIADFNNDGWPEVYVGNAIYDAATLRRLCVGPSGGNKGLRNVWSSSDMSALPFAANVLNDEKLELICGNTIYGVNIVSRTNAALNSISVLKTITLPSRISSDGGVAVVDFDGDGSLEVFVVQNRAHGENTYDTAYFYAYNPVTENILFIHGRYCLNAGFPLIGDIDGDGHLEFVYTDRQTNVANARITAIKYTPENGAQVMFQATHTDRSGMTSMTLFDFNQDGIMEIVYRDETALRIINASGKSHLTGNDTLPFYNLYSLNMAAGTWMENPVVAEVNNDGAAEIVVCGMLGTGPGGAGSNYQYQGHLVILGGIHPWAPTRKVWNQYMYNVTNINEDLTTPRYIFDNATFFTDFDGAQYQPYNNFLQQATTLTDRGRPYTAASDVFSTQASIQSSNDVFTITLDLSNQGDNALTAPYQITVYKNTYRGQVLYTQTISQSLPQSGSQTVTITLPHNTICSLVDVDSLVIALNDAGAGIAQHGNQSPECDTTNNIVTLACPHNSNGTDIQAACESFVWIDGNTYTTSNTTATHALNTVSGCDSIVTLNLTINHSTTGDTTAEACDSFTWYGETYTATTETPTHVGTNVAGCDSTTTLHLTVHYSTAGDTSAVACDNFTWYGTDYTSSTNAPTHHTTNSVGCDSTTTLHLTVNYSSAGDTSATACDSYTWYGNSYTVTTATPTHTLTGANVVGCDSTTTLHLTINYSSTGDTTVVACDNFTWYGTDYTSSTNVPTHHSTNSVGCDSTTTLHLTVNYSTSGDTMSVACDNFTWYGETYTASTNTPTHHSTNSVGCDSTTTLHLTVHYSTAGDTTAVACDNFTWYGTDYTSSTNAPTHHSTNSVGCDSTTTLHLTVHYSTAGDTTAVACDNFTWYGTNYTSSTNAPTHHSTNSVGCDSTTTLHLTVNHSTVGDTTAGACDSYTWYGVTYTTSTNSPTHVSTNVAGCDSTTTLHLTIRYSTAGDTTAVACDNFTWYGNNYTSSTSTPTHVSANVVGCDSTTTLHLTVNYSTSADTTSVACDNFMWYGETYTASTNTPTHHSTNSIGCDSTTTLHLTVHYSTAGDTTAVACDNFTWYGTDYTSSTNVPTHHSTNSVGCDSTTTLHLVISYSNAGDTTANACDSFTWYGVTYMVSTNSPTHVSTNVAGCDSTTTLHLTIRYSTAGDTTAVVCDSYTWYGNTYPASTNTPVHHSTNSVGCDSVITLHLTVNYSTAGDTLAEACDSYTWYGETYTASTNTPTHHSTNSVGCDSTTTLHLTVHYSTAGDTLAEACDSFMWYGETYTASTNVPTHHSTNSVGCDSTTTLHLVISYSNAGDTMANECDSFMWYGVTYTASTNSPTHVSTNVAGCDSTTTLHLTVRYSTVSEYYDTCVENALPRIFNGHSYTTEVTGTEVTVPNAEGCDSAIAYHLHIHWNTSATLDSTVCADRLPLTWNHRAFVTGGEQRDTLVNVAGADSLVLMRVNVNATYADTVTASICDNGSYSFEGSEYTTAGSHSRLLQTGAGCDSLRTLMQEVRQTTTGDTTAVACDSFTWYGTSHMSSTNSPTHVNTNAAGCDSTTTLHLTIHYSTAGDTSAVACDSYTWYGNTYTLSTNTPVHHSTNSVGCDSSITLYLTINHSTTRDTLVEACDSYTWYGTTYTASTNTPTHHSVNSVGCDSTTTLHLTIHYSTAGDTSAVACDSYTWYGNTYTLSTNMPTHHSANFVGCDSTTTLHLTIHYSTAGDTSAVACDSFTWYGETFTASTNSPTHVSMNAAGCDSTTTLHLTVRYSTGLEYYDTCVENALPRIFNGHSYPTDTSDSRVFVTNSVGCDSVITYNLYVHRNYLITLDSSLCNDSLPITWNGVLFDTLVHQSATLVRSVTHTAVTGADSVVQMALHVHPLYNNHLSAEICKHQKFSFGGHDYNVQGDYTDTLRSVHGCDSLSTLHLEVRDTYEQYYFDTICHGDTYEWRGHTIHGTNSLLTEDFLIRDTLTTGYGCDSVDVLSLTKMAQPQISLQADTDCMIPGYHLSVRATAPLSAGEEPGQIPYLYWSSAPVDDILVGQENSDAIVVSPQKTTEYMLYADYHEAPLCPATASIVLNPVVVPEAILRVTPSMLLLENMHVVAQDKSKKVYPRRSWYVDGVKQVTRSNPFEYDVDAKADSVSIWLEVYNGQCRDTAKQTLYVYRVNVWAPNVFTPSLESNNMFYLSTQGVLEGELFIYDRIGDLVFHTTDMTQGWDGTHNGTPCIQRAYVWTFRYRSIDQPNAYQNKTGTVLLLR